MLKPVMMEQPLDRLLAISSVQHAIKAEKMLKAAGIRVMMIPTPREIDLSCGQCLLFAAAEQERCLQLLLSGRVRWSALYRRAASAVAPPSWLYEKLAEEAE